MRVAAAAAAFLSALAAAGCGGGGGGGGPSESVDNRRRMPSCGAYDAPVGALAPESRSARDCLLTAFREGREAEVAITVVSIEGDPITTIYRVLGPLDVELFVDASADKFGAVDTYHQRCTSVAEEGTGLVATGCTTLSES